MGFLLAVLLVCSACDTEQAKSPASSSVASAPSSQGRGVSVTESATATSSANGKPPSPATKKGRRFVLLLHGLGGSGKSIERHFGFAGLSRELGFEFEAPDGSLDSAGRRFWNAGPSCCDFDATGVDHVQALAARLDQALARYGSDTQLFVVGYSNGGFMAHRLACERPGVTGILSVAGTAPNDVENCSFAPERVLHVHGDSDEIVSYAGGHVFSNEVTHTSAEYSVSAWGQKRGCKEPLQEGPKLDLESDLAGKETTVLASSCAPALQLFRVRGGSHNVVANPSAMRELLVRMFADRKN